YKNRALPRDNDTYITSVPDKKVVDKVRLFLLHEYTFVGAPHIWNGDEMGMTGADDPDCRKPLTWPDIQFDNESNSTFSKIKYENKISFDAETFQYYKDLTALRKTSKAFSLGDMKFIHDWDSEGVLAYTRTYNGETFLVILS